jgi:hypothetical protein
MTLYAATVFLSAFLLFLVQPLIAKYILPWFGGSSGVWTACLLFFQVLLTAGYGYAHLLADRFKQRSQAVISIAFLLLTTGLLPITPSKTWVPDSVFNPTWHIWKLLFATVGACYFLLSSTTPLLQSWFSKNWPRSSPYRLYTLSNIGSLLAITSYPLLLEPRLGLSVQTRLWSWFYCAFVILCGACAIKLWKTSSSQGADPAVPAEEPVRDTPRPPQLPDRVLWLGLTALSSTMLMATTNQLCLDVAVVPLLWLLPMGLYLLSFILCFHSKRWYWRPGFGIALAAALTQACVVLNRDIHISLKYQIISYSFTLFVCCMVCHGELVRIKPETRYLTSFYLMISAGGALGGVFVSLIAPHIFRAYWEFHAGLAATALIFLIILFRDRSSFLFAGRPAWAWTFLLLAFLVLISILGIQIRGTLSNALVVKRNFFGVLRVTEADKKDPAEARLILMNGRIEHGNQYLAQDKQHWPTSYFGMDSGVGIAIRYHPRRLNPSQHNLRAGIVGLGTGTISVYGQKGDYFRFYEMNPDVIELSNSFFSYQKDSHAKVEVVPGDARISMEGEKSRKQPGEFDVLVVDAFSSDAIPVHLLTRECYSDYWYHLRKDGILALHISNRHFNLSPVIRSLAENDQEHRPQAVLVEDLGNILQKTDASDWILVTSNQEFLANRNVKAAITPWREEHSKRFIFTDDYCDIFRLLL